MRKLAARPAQTRPTNLLSTVVDTDAIELSYLSHPSDSLYQFSMGERTATSLGYF